MTVATLQRRLYHVTKSESCFYAEVCNRKWSFVQQSDAFECMRELELCLVIAVMLIQPFFVNLWNNK